jgi:hypothetical protein
MKRHAGGLDVKIRDGGGTGGEGKYAVLFFLSFSN